MTTDGRPGPEGLYLDLLKKSLTRYLFIAEEVRDIGTTSRGWEQASGAKARLTKAVRSLLGRRGLRLVHTGGDPELRAEGLDWPLTAETMVGLRRLDNVERCIETVLAERIPGDLIETGVWRGGCSIFMRGVLAAHGDTTRAVWLADSFEGLAAPDPEAYPDEYAVDLSNYDVLAVGLRQVEENFRRYGLLDDQVRFLPGWFKDTLPDAPIEQLSLLRLDGDYYESTHTALVNLYPKLSPGGFVIVDDYHTIDACRAAVHDYATSIGEDVALTDIDGSSAFWRKQRQGR